MNFENNWKNKSLENLEKDYWNEPADASYLVSTCHKLRKKQLKDYEIEDLRIMIGQNIGLNYLIPIVIDQLNSDILAEGDFYKGDLLKNVLTSEIEYWKRDKKNWVIVCEIFKANEIKLKEFETTWEIRKGWFDSFKEFKKIND